MTLNFTIPTSWNELTTRQRSKISDLIFNAEQGSKGVYFAILFHLFCPAEATTIKGWKERYKFLRLILQVPFRELIQYIEFIFKDLNLTKFPKSVKIAGVEYFGPADRLSNISIEELNFAYKFYFDWISNKDISALDRLVTTLYRPATNEIKGDVREAFNEHLIQSRGNIFPKLPEEQKISIGFAFKGSVEYMFSKYPVIFPVVKSKTETKPKYHSMVPMMNAMFMGENQPLGTRTEVVKTNAYIFFDVAQETVKDAKKRELELKRKRR